MAKRGKGRFSDLCTFNFETLNNYSIKESIDKTMLEKNKYVVIVSAAAFSIIVTYLHIAVAGGLSPDVILEELYYLPLLLGALLFGLRGALVIYVFVSLLYLNFFYGISKANLWVWADRLLHLVATGLFAIITGLLVERERKLQRQMEKARYLSSIGQVATTIVHDLKNPLIVILGFAKRIRDGKGNIGGAAQAIIESAENMQRIVHDVLDFSKPIKLELKSEDLCSIVQKASDYCKSKASEKGVFLTVNIPDNAVNNLIDAFALQRALVNLINNGIEASAVGQRVTVSLEPGSRFQKISIKDSGSGMDREVLENIFTPFFTRKRGGTGLGMAIAKKVIEGHEGRILVDSKMGAGTTITIELPQKGG